MELKACPFCGGEAEWDSEGRKDTDYVMCMKCRVRTKYYPYVTEAISAWNQRADLSNRSHDLLKPFGNLADMMKQIIYERRKRKTFDTQVSQGTIHKQDTDEMLDWWNELRKIIAQTKEKE